MNKNLGIGFTGSHRTGKSTLAKLMAERTGIIYNDASVSAIFARLGYDPSKDYDLKTRLVIQNAILDHSNAVWDSFEGMFITDRTPIDFMAYMIASAHQEEITSELDAEVQTYLSRCMDSANKYFGMIFEVLPAIPIVADSGKASITKTYVDHIAYLISGITTTCEFNPRILFPLITKDMVSVEDRMDYCMSFMDED